MSNISKQGQHFLLDLNAYLTIKGLDEKEIKSFIDEAEAHLIEGEANGKTVEDIFGQTPKQYAEEVAQEMTFSVKQNLKYLLYIILGATAFGLLGDAIEGNISFSWITLIGYPISYAFALIMFLMGIRHSSFKTRWAGFSMAYLYAIFGFSGFIGVALADKQWGEPVIQFAQTGTAMIGAVAILLFILLAFLLKTWFVILVPFVLFGPALLFKLWNLTDPFYGLLGWVISISLFGLVMLISYKQSGKKTKK